MASLAVRDWEAAHDMRLGQQVRAGSGYSTVLADFDFETYSEAGFIWDEAANKWGKPKGAGNKKGLEITGMRGYIEHPTFEVISLAYDLKDGKGPRHWWPGSPDPQDLLDYLAAGGLIEAWNSGFEFLVWNIFCVRVFGWKPLEETQMRCAMAKARVFAMPGKLDNAGEVLNIAHKKDPDGKRLLDKFSIPCNPLKTKPNRRRRYLWEEPDEAVKLAQYNIRDIVSEAEVSIRCPDMSADELLYWQIDQRINRRGVAIDTKALDDLICVYEQACNKYGAQFRAITGGIEYSEGEQFKGWLRAQGCFVENLEWETIDAKLKELESRNVSKQDNVYRTLKIRASLGSASVKKLYAIKNSMCNGRLYDLFIFFGARTGRWTAVGAQPQNLYKGSLIKSPADQERALAVIATRCLEYVELEYGDAVEIVACAIRALFIAGVGYDLIASDFSAIEGVVAACLAREEWMIEVFKTHGKLYESLAAKMTGKSIDELLQYKKDTGNHHPLRNGLGKLAALSGQFGAWIAGWKRFGAEQILGSDENIKAGILQYRDSVPNIVEMWGGQSRGGFGRGPQYQEYFGLEGAIVQAIKNPGQAFAYRDIIYQVDPIEDILYCQVPSGGLITYHSPRLSESRREWAAAWEVSISYEGWNNNIQMGPIGWQRMDLYGGKAFENVVQKVARAFQAHAMVNVEAGGYEVVLHGHDELVSEVPIGFGPVEDFERRANTLPEWAVLDDDTPWPIKMSGGWRGPRYGKFD